MEPFSREWLYRGEGDCSLVVANSKKNQVYRLVKTYFTEDPHSPGYQRDETKQLRSCDHIKAEQHKVVDYVHNVIQPLLSDKFVSPLALAYIPEGFREEIARCIAHTRPVRHKGREVDDMDAAARTCLVMPDFCYVQNWSSPPPQPLAATISVEIKPKKALMQIRDVIDIDPVQAVRYRVCKFCLHQQLKVKKGQWPNYSEYCPLDLFSGYRQRMKHALMSLIRTPQNNLKICKNGEEVYSQRKTTDLFLVLRDFFNDNQLKKQKCLSMFLDLVTDILLGMDPQDSAHSLHASTAPQTCSTSSYQSKTPEKPSPLPRGCILERILSIQRLDDFDIQQIHPIYLKLKEHLKMYPEKKAEWCLDGPYSEEWLMKEKTAGQPGTPPSLEQMVHLVKRFLVSKTLQDCSIMMAVTPVAKGESSGLPTVCVEGRRFVYSIQLVDLDPKAFDKIAKYFQQDEDIMEAYNKMLKGSSSSLASPGTS